MCIRDRLTLVLIRQLRTCRVSLELEAVHLWLTHIQRVRSCKTRRKIMGAEQPLRTQIVLCTEWSWRPVVCIACRFLRMVHRRLRRQRCQDGLELLCRPNLERPLGRDTRERLQTQIARRRRRLESSIGCLLYTSPSPRDLSTSRMPSSA